MSLRRLYKMLLLVLIAACGVGIGVWLLSPEQPAPRLNPVYRDLAANAQVTRGTVMALGGPAVDYALPASVGAIRILTNANLPAMATARQQRQADPARRWQYAIEVEEVLADGSSRRRIHQFRRDLAEVELPGGGRGTGLFYLQSEAPSPLAAATLRLDYAGAARPSRLRVRLVSADGDIGDVLLRAAVPESVTLRSAETMWRRLSADQRDGLASGNLFPADLLIEQERANLLASRWRPLGPTGEVVRRDIYTLDVEDRGAIVDPVQSAMIKAGPDRLAVLQLPEKGARVRIELEPVVDDGCYPAWMTLHWAGHSAFQRQLSSHDWFGGNFSKEFNLGGGWLEVGASRNAIVRVQLLDKDKAQDITPPVRFLRTWAVQPDAPLEFPITHADRAPTPLRLVLRRIGNQGVAPVESPVQVALLGPDGAVLRTLSVPLRPLAWSRYDGLWPEQPGAVVTDPIEAFLRVPLGVSRIRVTASEPTLVVGYSRPADLARAVRTPEDTTVPEAAVSAIPAWFALQPEDAEARMLNSATRLLTVQERLPDDRPELISGRYQWEDFSPVNQGAARVFLAPREAGVPERTEALAGIFRPLPTTGTLVFTAEPGRSAVAARLAWAADSPRTFRYAIAVDGQPWASGAASGSAGEVALPPFAAGPHRIDITADASVRWFANHVTRGQGWVKRTAFRFDKPLQFEIDRITSEEEFLSVRLFRPARTRQRLQVRVAIDAPAAKEQVGPFPGWLFTQRVHDIRPSGEFALPVAETDGERADAGQPFFIPFPKGAPLGRYRVTLVAQGGASWVSASRITIGAAAKPKLILETTRNGE